MAPMTLTERKADVQRRREAIYYQMQLLEDQRRQITQRLAEHQTALLKLDGETELLESLLAETS